jgi:ParB/RepB/Spo0J family partition protein
MPVGTPETFAIDLLVPHPFNPRLCLHEDRIKSMTASMKENGFDPAFAIIVRKIQERLEILSGHHRVEAAKRAGLASVPCWVKDLDDEEAYMLLVTSNNQSELSPLEIGLHALHLDEARGGRGRKGGVSAYADQIGRSRGSVADYRMAAEVAEKVPNLLSELTDKTSQLAVIHKLPEAIWEFAIKRMLKYDWSVKETESRITQAKLLESHEDMKAYFGKSIPVPVVAEEPAKMQEEIKEFYGVGVPAPVGGEVLSRSVGELSASDALEMDVEPEETGSVGPRNAGLQDTSYATQGRVVSSGTSVAVVEPTSQVATSVAIQEQEEEDEWAECEVTSTRKCDDVLDQIQRLWDDNPARREDIAKLIHSLSGTVIVEGSASRGVVQKESGNVSPAMAVTAIYQSLSDTKAKQSFYGVVRNLWEADKPRREKTTGFVKPSFDEVKAYCDERKNGIDPQAFLDHYDACGWVIGATKKPVADWKGCVRTWEQSRKEKQKAEVVKSAPKKVVECDAVRRGRELEEEMLREDAEYAARKAAAK